MEDSLIAETIKKGLGFMKKIIMFALAISLALTLAGCSNSNRDIEDQTKTEEIFIPASARSSMLSSFRRPFAWIAMRIIASPI